MSWQWLDDGFDSNITYPPLHCSATALTPKGAPIIYLIEGIYTSSATSFRVKTRHR